MRMLSGMGGLFIGMGFWEGDLLCTGPEMSTSGSCSKMQWNQSLIILYSKPQYTPYCTAQLTPPKRPEQYHLPVKSVSNPDSTASAFSHVHDASGLAPHGHDAPLTVWFSLVARSHVHCPAGRDPSFVSWTALVRVGGIGLNIESEQDQIGLERCWRDRFEHWRNTYGMNTWLPRCDSQFRLGCRYSVEHSRGHRSIWPGRRRRSRKGRFDSR